MNLKELQQQFNPTVRLCNREGVKTMTQYRYNEIMNILQKDATHSERIWVVGFLKWIGFTAEEVMDIIDKNNQWLNYKRGISWYQVCSIFKIKANMPRSTTRRRRRKQTLPSLPTTANQRKKMRMMADWMAHQKVTKVLREIMGSKYDGVSSIEEPIDCDREPIFQNGFVMGYGPKHKHPPSKENASDKL